MGKKYPLLKDGDIVMADASEDYNGICKSIEVLNLDNKKAIAGLHTFLLRDRNDTLVNGFKGYITASHLLKNQFDRLATGMKVYGVSKNNLLTVQIPIPSKPEQQAIATALSDTDALIDSLEKLISKKEAIKTGTMQELLTGKKRLDGFSGEWEEKSLSDVALLGSGKRIYLFEYVLNGIPFYRGKEISELKNKTKIENILYISRKKYLQIKRQYGVPVEDDILITAVGTLGNIYRIDNDEEFYFKDGNLIWLKNIKVNSIFLTYILTYFQQKILDSAIGSTQKALTIVALNKIIFRFPIFNEEQEAIVTILSDMDSDIDALKTKLSKVKAIKEGMMQELLTGRTRLV